MCIRPIVARLSLLSILLVVSVLQPAQQAPTPSAALLEEARQLGKQAEQAARDGKGKAAVDALKKKAELERKASATKELAGTLDLLANFLQVLEDFPAARDSRKELVTVREKLDGAGHWRVTDERWALRRLEKQLELDAPGRKQLAESDRLVGQLGELNEQKKYREGLVPARRAADLRKKYLGADHPDVAECLDWLGWFHYMLSEDAAAEKSYTEVVALREKSLGKDHPKTADALYWLGSSIYASGKDDAAEPVLRKAAGIQKLVLGEQDLNYSYTLARLGKTCARLAKHEEAESLLREVLALRVSHRGKDAPETAKAHEDLVRYYEDRARESESRDEFAAAVERRGKVLDLYRERLGERDWHTTDARLDKVRTEKLSRLKAVERQRLTEAVTFLPTLGTLSTPDQYRQAIPQCARVAAVCKELLGDDSIEYARALQWQGWFHHLLGKEERSIALYLEAIPALIKAVGEEHPYHAEALYEYAGILLTTGKPAEALPLARRAVELRAKTLGTTEQRTVDARRRLVTACDRTAVFHEEEQDFDKALPLREEARSLLVLLQGDKHWEVIDADWNVKTCRLLASLSESQRQDVKRANELHREMNRCGEAGQYRTAITPGREAVELRRRLLGADHPDYLTSASDLGWMYRESSDYAAAEPLLKEALEGQKKSLGEMHPSTALRHNVLGWLYKYQGRLDEAERLFRRAGEIFSALFGENHTGHATSLSNQAEVCMARKQYTLAEPLYQRALRIREAVQGKNHGDCAEIVVKLARLQRDNSELSRAEETYRRAVRLQQSALGATHATTIETLGELAAVCLRREDFAAARKVQVEVVEALEKAPGRKGWEVAEARAALRHATRLAELDAPARKRLAEAVTALRQTAALNQKNQLAEALTEAQKAAAVRKELLGTDDTDYRDALDWVAFLHGRKKEWKLADDAYRAKAELERKALGDRHPQVARTQRVQMMLQVTAGHLEETDALCRGILALRRESLGNGDKQTRESVKDLDDWVASVAARAGASSDFQAASKAWEESVQLRAELYGPTDWRTTDSRWAEKYSRLRAGLGEQDRKELHDAERLEKLARDHNRSSRSEEALRLGGQSLAAYRKLLSSDHPETAKLQAWLASVLKEREDYVRAEELLRPVPDVYRRTLGADNPVYAGSLADLADLYVAMKLHVQAGTLYLQALEAYSVGLGSENEKYAQTLTRLGRLHNTTAQYALARDAFEQALAIQRRVLGPEHVRVANALLWLGWSHHQLGENEKAEPVLRSALVLAKKKHGETDAEVAGYLPLLARVVEQRERYDEAGRLYREALAILRPAGPNRRADVEKCLDALIGMEEQRGREAEQRGDLDAARRIWTAAAALRAERYGADDWQAASARLARRRVEVLTRLNPGERRLLDEADEWVRRARTLDKEGRTRDALDLAGQAAKARRQFLGEDDPDHAAVLEQQAQFHSRLGELAQAEELLRRAVASRNSSQGAKHPEAESARRSWLQTLERLVDQQTAQDSAQGKKSAAMLVAGRIQQFGANHWQVTDARWKARRIDRLAGLSPEQRSRWHEAGALIDRGKALVETGNYRDALQPLREARDIYRALPAADDPVRAEPLHWLGVAHFTLGDYAWASPLLQEAASVRKQLLGEEHPDYAASLDWQGWLDFVLRDLDGAERLWERSLAIRRKALEPDHADLARGLNNLWLLHTARGDSGRAEPLYRQILEVHRKAWGEDHPEFARAMEGLGDVYLAQAEQERLRAGLATPGIQALYKRAEALYLQVKQIRRVNPGINHPDYPASLARLGNLYARLGEPLQAEEMLTSAVAERRRLLGKQHPDYAQSLFHLARFHDEQGNPRRAEPLLAQALEITRGNLELTFSVQSEQQQFLLTQALRVQLDAYVALAARAEIPADRVYAHVLAWKGAVFARQQRLRVERGNPELRADFDRLGRAVGQLAQLVFAPPVQGNLDAWRQRVEALTAEKEQLEAELARRSEAFRDQRESARVSAEGVQRSLPAGCALLDFLEYSTPGSTEKSLAVFVLRQGQALVQHDLGPLKRIAETVQRWRGDVEGSADTMDGAARTLRRLIWEPIEDRLAGCHTILISPDAVLARFPFAALPGTRPGTYLLEDLRFAVVPAPQLLAGTRRPEQRRAAPALLLLGDVNFGASPGLTNSSPSTERKRAAVRGTKAPQFDALPETAAEIRSVRGSFLRVHPEGVVRELAGEQATEAAFRDESAGCRYLHLATHGFFAPGELWAGGSLLAGSEIARGPRGGLPAGLLCGLALTGANRRFQPVLDGSTPTDDGILTALEVAELDLAQAELVVLSACETGLGREAAGEGLLGLQRAFQVAGARAAVSSLWTVDDRATRQLMAAFYSHLWRDRLPPLEALRLAQLQAMRGEFHSSRPRGLGDPEAGPSAEVDLRRHPRMWAAWVLSGGPDSLLQPSETIPDVVTVSPGPILLALIALLGLLIYRARRLSRLYPALINARNT